MRTSWSEEWRDVPGYEGRYQVSDMGRMRGRHQAILRPFRNHNGYLIATLLCNGEKRRTGVHRLVAQAFIPNPDGKPQINHKDGNKENNAPTNLEWVTCSENNLHRRRVLNGGGGRAPRPVVCMDTGVVYPSITAASEATGAQLPKILLCCQGKRKQTAGMRWAYAGEVEACGQ